VGLNDCCIPKAWRIAPFGISRARGDLIILQFPNPRGREVDKDVTHVTEYGHFLESSNVKIWVQVPEALSKRGDDVMCYHVCVILHGINIRCSMPV